jgi:RHS repeat-associated protein
MSPKEAPGGWEQYAQGGTPQVNFTGQRHMLSPSDMWDFPLREQHSTQGRWLSPDPAGLAAVDITDPQTWNRYAYVRNNPLALVDPSGLDDCAPGDTLPCTVTSIGTAPPDWEWFLYRIYFGWYQGGFGYPSSSPGGRGVGGGVPAKPPRKPPTKPGPAANNGPDPVAVQKSMQNFVKQALKAAVTQGLCGSSPTGAILNSMKFGAARGTVVGAWAGGGAVGVETFGLGTVPGAIFGGFIGGTAGAGGGVLWGGARAGICSLAEAYGSGG